MNQVMKYLKEYIAPRTEVVAAHPSEMIASTITQSTKNPPEVHNTEFDAKDNSFDWECGGTMEWNDDLWK